MVHTAQLTYFPDADMIQRFIHLDGIVSYKQDHAWINYSLKDSGIKLRLQTIYQPYYTSPRISCIVNFKKLIAPDNKIDVLNVWEIDAAEQRFNELIKPLGLPQLKYWKTHRIDYCVNIKTSYVEDYLKLMEKGDRPRLRDWYDRSSRNYGQKSGESLYLVSTAKRRKNRSCTVNFYNKQNERLHTIAFLEDESEWQQFDEIMELSADILRLEIQCHKPKTESIKNRYGFESKSIMYYLDPIICDEVISTYLKRISGTADYHTKKVALDMIAHSKCRIENKEKMEKIIQDISRQHSSIAKVREKYIAEGYMDSEEYNKLIRSLYSINVNPVTIGDSIIRKYGKRIKDNGLTSVYELYKSALEDETTTSID